MSEIPQTETPAASPAGEPAPGAPAAADGATAAAEGKGGLNPASAIAEKLDAKPYSGIPLENKRDWVVPKWLKEAFVAFAVLCVGAVVASKVSQHWGGELERAKAAVDADDLEMPAPAFKLPLRGGGEIDSSQLKGKLTLVNFWATWCPPCREEEPSLEKLTKAFDPGSFQVVAVSVDDGWEPIEKFFTGRTPAYRVLWDEGGKTSLRYGTSKFPESYLLDSSGRVRLKFIGPRDWMQPAMFALLAEMGAKRIGVP
jgi:thiol-disulfide isomerase/thioredoxin